MDMILNSIFNPIDIVCSILVLPACFLAQPQACAVVGVFFSPLLRADWAMFAEKMMQCNGSGTSGLSLPHPARQSILRSLLSHPDTPCSLCKGDSSVPCRMIWKVRFGLKPADLKLSLRGGKRR